MRPRLLYSRSWQDICIFMDILALRIETNLLFTDSQNECSQEGPLRAVSSIPLSKALSARAGC